MKSELTRKVATDLENTEAKVKQALAEDEQERHKKLEEVTKMETDFVGGVEQWRRRSQRAIEDLGNQQTALQNAVGEASLRMKNRKALALRNQQERQEMLQKRCAKLISICREQIDNSDTL